MRYLDLIFIVCMSFFFEFDELKFGIYSILCIVEIYIFQLIYYLD